MTLETVGHIILGAAAIIAVLAVVGVVGFFAYIRFALVEDEPWSPLDDVRPERRS